MYAQCQINLRYTPNNTPKIQTQKKLQEKERTNEKRKNEKKK